MAIAPELNRFNSEADFTTKFLIPLIQQLGFSVVYYHGTREFGRDLIFAEIDKFGNVRYHAMQAKFVDSISLTASHDLIRDCEQAFAVPFNHPQTGLSHRISTFYAVNGGTISEQAKELYFNSLLPKFGSNIMLIDGAGLVALDRFALAGQPTRTRERLTGLVWEIHLNDLLLAQLKPKLERLESLSDPIPLMRVYGESAMSFIKSPLITNMDFAVPVLALAENLRRINYLLDGIDRTDNIHYFRANVAEARQLIPLTEEQNVKVKEQALAILASLGSRLAL